LNAKPSTLRHEMTKAISPNALPLPNSVSSVPSSVACTRPVSTKNMDVPMAPAPCRRVNFHGAEPRAHRPQRWPEGSPGTSHRRTFADDQVARHERAHFHILDALVRVLLAEPAQELKLR